jgi:2-oxoglutarate ferredoxin oxidoreductase subunit alpha
MKNKLILILFLIVSNLQAQGYSVAHAHIKYVRPFPKNLATLLGNYKRILIPEINNGQLVKIIRDQFLVDAVAFNKIKGTPITSQELVEAIKELL